MTSSLRHMETTQVESPMGAKSVSTTCPTLLALPSEIIDQVLDYLAPAQLVHISQTCRRLAEIGNRDSRWEQYVHRNVTPQLQSCAPYRSFKDLYKAHSPFWFLTRHKLWFSDGGPHGKLLLARYDYRTGSIEAYALAGKDPRPRRPIHVLDWEHDVAYQDFSPRVQLDLNQPVIRLLPERIPLPGAASSHAPTAPSIEIEDPYSGTPYKPEARMQIPSAARNYSDHLNRTFMHTRNLPQNLCDTRTSLWPPLIVPSVGNARTRASSGNSFASKGHQPSSWAEASTTSFRLHQRMNFQPFAPLQSIFSSTIMNLDGLAGDQVETFSTIDPTAYTPTAEKPWQGIYVGDYSAHGCEFLLITQPDAESARPLPRKARRALEKWPYSSRWESLLADQPGEEDELFDDDADIVDEGEQGVFGTALSATAQMQRYVHNHDEQLLGTRFAINGLGPTQNSHQSDAHSLNDHRASNRECPFKGRLEAIKLTGDPNVPRGEYTFVADDLSERGLAGYTKDADFVESRAASEGRTQPYESEVTSSDDGVELTPSEQRTRLLQDPDFKGTRMVRSVGHVCDQPGDTRRESYIPSQLVLMSPDKIAQYWMPFQHMSFYQRVQWEDFLKIP